MTAGGFLQALVSGLANGAVYGLVAMGFALTYGATRIVAFAHGDIVGAAVAGAVAVVLGSTPVVTSPAVGKSIALVALALALGGLLSVGTYLVVIRPFVRTGRGLSAGPAVASWIGGGLVIGLLLRQLVASEFPRDATAVPDPFRLDRITSTGVLNLPGDANVPARVIGVIAVGGVVALAVELMLSRTLIGHAISAVSSDPTAAGLSGIAWRRMLPLAFAVAGILAALAGLLAVPGRALAAETGVILGLKAVAAALLWRLGSPGFAFLGGLVLGVAEAVVVTTWGPAWSDVAALAVLVVVIAARPHGLASRAEREIV